MATLLQYSQPRLELDTGVIMDPSGVQYLWQGYGKGGKWHREETYSTYRSSLSTGNKGTNENKKGRKTMKGRVQQKGERSD